VTIGEHNIGVCEVCGHEMHPIYNLALGSHQQHMLRCMKCGCCQVDVPFPEEALNCFYKEQYFAQFGFDQMKNRLLAKDYYTKCCRYIEKSALSPLRVLEIGSGYGAFAATLARRYHANVSVVEISERCVNYIQSHYPEIQVYPVPIGDISKSGVKEFDFVFSGHCLEHLQTFDEYFEALATLVKPGGISVTLTPNAVSEMFTRWSRGWEWCCPEQHFQFLSTRAPAEFFEKYGFELVEITSVAPAPIHCPGDWLPLWALRFMRVGTPSERRKINACPTPYVRPKRSMVWRAGRGVFNAVLPIHRRKIVSGRLAGMVSSRYDPSVRDELVVVLRRKS
jgi:SAM-dependent methyltransferase